MTGAVERLTLKNFRCRLVSGSFTSYPDLAAAMEGMQFVQADPIRAPARAQDLILRQRVRDYRAGRLENEFPSLKAEEGFLFAYGFMRQDVWRDLCPRPRAKLGKREREVLEVVSDLGEAHPRQLDDRFGRRRVRNCWGGKSQATKRILEDLHHHGFLRVSRREKGIRVYQVPDISTSDQGDPKQRYARLAMVTARVFGPTSVRFLLSELAGLRHLLPERALRKLVIEELVSARQLSKLEVDGMSYLWAPDDWTAQEVPDRVRILTPFDPLVRDRLRFEQVWGWRYRFEAYVPPAKRQLGYYAMPLLWRDQVIGWANAKVEAGVLKVHLGWVGKRPKSRGFREGVEAEVEAMATFLDLRSGAWKFQSA